MKSTSRATNRILDHITISFLILLVSAASMACGNNGTSTSNQNENGDDGVEIEITYPEADSFENRSRFRVRGTAEGTSTVEVNGETASVSGGQWEVLLDFNDGPATVTAVAADTSVSVDFFVDTVLPELVIETPDRGAVVDAADDDIVIIKGQATDEGSGLLAILIDGSIIDDEDGAFEVERPLREGINVFTVVARDRAHNETTEVRAVLHGPLADPSEAIDQAVTMDITPGGIADLAEVIEAYATPEQIMGFMEGGFGDSDLTVTEIDWDELTFEIVPRDGYLDIEVYITELHVEGDYQVDDANPDSGYIHITEMTVRLHLEVYVDDDGELAVAVPQDSAEVDLETSDIDSDLPFDNNTLRALIRGGIVFTFTDFVTDLITENLYDSGILTQEFEFLDRVIEIRLILEEVLISTNGVRVNLGIEFPADPHPEVQLLPGALHRATSSSTGSSLTSPFRLHSTRTALDRVLHSVWQAGLFHQTIGGDDLDGIRLPFDLTADGLASLLDQRIRDIHDTDTPVELRFRPLLPPVMEFDDNDEILVDIADFLIDFYLRPEGEDSTHILSVALYLTVEVEIVLDEHEVRFNIDVDADGDIAEEPIFTFDRDRTVNLITDLIEVIPQLAAGNLSIDGQANFEWASIGDLLLEINGESRDRITAGLTISPATDFIEDDEVDPSDDD